MHYHTKSSDKLEELREEPQVNISLPSGGPLRSMIYKFDIKSTRNLEGHNNQCVYYLAGDERRAVRKFIKVNSDFVKQLMEMGDSQKMLNQLVQNDWFVEIFAQEFEIMMHKDEI